MSLYGLDPLGDANVLDRLTRMGEAPKVEPGFFTGIPGATVSGVGEGIAKVAQFQADPQFEAAASVARGSGRDPNDILVEMMTGEPAGGMEAFGSYDPHPFGKLEEQTPDEFEASAKEQSRAWVEQFKPDPEKVGMAGQILHGLTSMVSRAYLGGAVAGPAGAGLLVGATEKHSQYEELRAQGVDPATAGDVSTVSGLTSGIGAVIPGAYGKSLLTRLATGAAGNVALGGVSRGITHSILDGAGYPKMAEQYKVLDAQSVAADTVLGLAFGGVHHLFHVEPAHEPAPSVVDAALMTNEGLHAQVDTAAGIPATPEAMAAHIDNLTRAAEQLMNDEPVSGMRPVETVSRPEHPAAIDAQREIAEALGLHAEEVLGKPIPGDLLFDPDIAARVAAGMPRTTDEAYAAAVQEMTPELQSDLAAATSTAAEPGAVAAMRAERAAAVAQLAAVSERGLAQSYNAIRGVTRKAAEAMARRAAADRAADLQGRIARLDQQIEANRDAAQAQSDLSAVNAGKIPTRFEPMVQARARDILSRPVVNPLAAAVREGLTPKRAPARAAEPAPAGERRTDAKEHARLAELADLNRQGKLKKAELVEYAKLLEADRLAAKVGDRRIQGVLNDTAYHEAMARGETLPTQGFVDMDMLKSLNDEMGHGVGDQAIRALGEALARHFGEGNVFRRSSGGAGDEFIVQSKTPEEHAAKVAAAQAELAKLPLRALDASGKVIGERIGLGFSHGQGKTVEIAEQAAYADKRARAAAGLRSERGTPNAGRVAAKPGPASGEGGNRPAESTRPVADLATREAIQTAQDALQARPDISVTDLATHEPIPAADALRAAEQGIADAADEGHFAQVAAACFGRGA